MKKNITIILLALTALIGSVFASENQLKSTALKAVDLLFFNGDNDAFLEFVAADAERKTNGEGSAVESFKKQKEGTFTKATLSEIVFVTSKSVPELREIYPDDMWNENRILAHLDDGLGCLVLVDVGEGKKGMMFFVLKDIDGQGLITYFDDN